MNNRYEPPSLGNTGFNCPHCGVRAVQKWAYLYKRDIEKDAIPRKFTEGDVDYWEEKVVSSDESDEAERILSLIKRMMTGEVFVEEGSSTMHVHTVNNLLLATCEHCDDVTVWLYDKMIYPMSGDIPAHDDLPENVKRTFAEASRISAISPRASAALSRLALQELCIHLKCKAENLNEQIAELVGRGLNPDIQQMLDAVRVIGNNAVHPGEIDLKDDEETARFLLNCINRICQRMITERLEAQKLFDQLPPGARSAIERRNEKLARAPGNTGGDRS